MSRDSQLLESLKQVTIELRGARERLRRLEDRDGEPIAIVGMSCRFPGGIDSPDDLWDLVAGHGDAISAFPSDRGWPLDRLFDPDPDNPGTSYVSESSFLRDAPGFDASFFGIRPGEAEQLDPQTRLLLEGAWEAIEGAGLAPADLRGTRTGLFAGLMQYGYGHDPADAAKGKAQVADGGLLSGYIAYLLGLEGPTMSVDTACSSSLVAMHLAVQALRRRECSLALAGGATVIFSPDIFVGMSRGRVLAPDGRCKAFAEAADGVGWSEGAGLLLLQRLSDAQRDGNEVLAVVRGSAVNQDGASNGFTAPNGPAQERVIRQALADAGLETADIDAVEAHGTGTPLGDPIEARALLSTYGRGRDGSPLWLGSLKSNLGHMQAAAGIGGVIKMAMAMRNGILPPTLHVDAPTSQVDWSAGEVELLTEPRSWERSERPRRAGVSSFGAGGTNAHLILEEPPSPEPQAEASEPDGGVAAPFALSAKSEVALGARARALHSHLRRHPELAIGDVASSLAFGRTQFEHRAVVSASGRDDLLAGLDALARGEDAEAVVSGVAGSGAGPVFLFPGQGSQWRGMAVELIEASPLFARSMGECEEALSPHLDWSLEAVLRGTDEAGNLARIDVVQPALFAVMVSLAALWRSYGVEPTAVVGHSQGEIAAVHVAGGLSLEDAARLVALRSAALALGTGKGGMAALAISGDELTAQIPAWEERVSLAAINGPSSIVVAAADDALDELLGQCEAAGVWTHRVGAAVGPGHSPVVGTLREPLLQSAAGIVPLPTEIPFYSSLAAGPVDTAELDAEYWYRNARETVRFGPTVQRAIGDGYRRFVEVSPHPILALPLREAFAAAADTAADATFTASLNREEGGLDGFGRSLGAAWSRGIEIDWEAALPQGRGKRVPLPTYPFQREHFWLQPGSAVGGDPAATGQAPAGHPLLGAALDLAEGEGRLFTGRLSLDTHPWLADHGGLGVVLLPGSAFVELALYAGERIGCGLLRELTLEAPLIFPERGAVQIQVSVSEPDEEGLRTLSIHSRPERDEEAEGGGWFRNASGALAPGGASTTADFDAAVWPPNGADPVEIGGFYEALAGAGIEYGAAFQGLTAAWRRGDELFAEISLQEAEEAAAPSFCLHPALLDATVHSAAAFWLGEDEGEARSSGPRLPFSFGDVSLRAAGTSRLRVRLARGDDGSFEVEMADEKGVAVASIGSFATRPVPTGYFGSSDPARDALFALEWVGMGATAPVFEGSVVVVGDCEPGAAAGTGSLDAYADLGRLAAAIDTGVPAPDVVVIVVPGAREQGADGLLEDAMVTAGAVLRTAQDWLLDERFAAARLVFLTVGAVAAGDEDSVPGLAQAPVWGLIRSAQAESPGRFALIDVDQVDLSGVAFGRALALDEPNLAIRDGRVLAARLRRAGATAGATEGDPWGLGERQGTVLVTGGTGDLGGLVARHLVTEHGARDLLLASRSGAEAPGAEELRRELEGLGARVGIAACDVADREQLAELLGAVDPERPLVAVVHTAATLDDGVLGSLTPERLERVLAVKAAAAWHLHELTADMDLSAFVLFSSAAATVGNPGQANYAAANAFLDGLAAYRAARGLAATSLAWSLWERTLKRFEEFMRDSDLSRLARSGLAPIGDEQGLALLDTALALERPALAPIGFDFPALRAQGRKTGVPPILRDLVRIPIDRKAGDSLARRLAAVPESERQQVTLDFVRGQIADILGHDSPAAVDPQAQFLELGFDSLTALEFRNRLTAASGVRLAPSVAFDHPTCEALAKHLADLVGSPQGGADEVPPGILTSLFRNAHELGRSIEFAEILRDAAAFRPGFTALEESGTKPYSLCLAEGTERPRLVCLPSAAPISGPHEYAKLAKSFQGVREVLALRWPGFADMEPLPRTMAAAVSLQAASFVAAEDEPVVLVGHSTGGIFAHALACHLEDLGSPPAGLVLIDSYHPSQSATTESIGMGILGALLSVGESGVAIDDLRLTAMASYLQLAIEYEPAAISSPTLLVRATEPIGDEPAGADWQPRWDLAQEVVDVSGNHLTMVDAFAASTAEAISDWLGQAVGNVPTSGVHAA